MWLIKTDDGSKSTLCKKKEMMKLKIYLKRFESDHGGNMAEWCYLKMEEFFLLSWFRWKFDIIGELH